MHIPTHIFGLVWFYGKSIIISYLMQNSAEMQSIYTTSPTDWAYTNKYDSIFRVCAQCANTESRFQILIIQCYINFQAA